MERRTGGTGTGLQLVAHLSNLFGLRSDKRNPLCAGRTNADRAACEPGRQTVPVSFRNGENGLDPQCLACSDNTDSDFATIGDQNAGDRHW